jgi:hypothetical protein
MATEIDFENFIFEILFDSGNFPKWKMVGSFLFSEFAIKHFTVIFWVKDEAVTHLRSQKEPKSMPPLNVSSQSYVLYNQTQKGIGYNTKLNIEFCLLCC